MKDSINPYCPEADKPIERYCVMKADEKFIDCAVNYCKSDPDCKKAICDPGHENEVNNCPCHSQCVFGCYSEMNESGCRHEL